MEYIGCSRVQWEIPKQRASGAYAKIATRSCVSFCHLKNHKMFLFRGFYSYITTLFDLNGYTSYVYICVCVWTNWLFNSGCLTQCSPQDSFCERMRRTNCYHEVSSLVTTRLMDCYLELIVILQAHSSRSRCSTFGSFLARSWRSSSIEISSNQANGEFWAKNSAFDSSWRRGGCDSTDWCWHEVMPFPFM